MYTLVPHRPSSPFNRIRRNLRDLLGGRILVQNLQHKSGGPPQYGRLPSSLTAPRRLRRCSRHLCSGKRSHKQRPPNTSVTDSRLRSLGYPPPISSSLLRDSPIAQVYVEGHAIPPNAIIGGVDRRGPWHIARSFYEVRFPLFFFSLRSQFDLRHRRVRWVSLAHYKMIQHNNSVS